VYELRLSEDEAQRRCRAARVARQFPVLFEMLADASIHLTGIVLLAPYLTPENHREVLARARYRRKREIDLLVAELAPAREVPTLIEPLAAGLGVRAPLRGGWAAFAESQAGWVRQLVPGEGPTDAPSALDEGQEKLLGELVVEKVAAPARHPVGPDASAMAPVENERRIASVRYRVQFTADQAYVDLLEQARALLWHRLPSGDLAQIQKLALEALVEKLVCRKYGAEARSATSEARSRSAANADPDGDPATEGRASRSATEGSRVERTVDESAVATGTSLVIDPGAAPSPRLAAAPPGTTGSALERSGAPSSDDRPGPDRGPPATSRRRHSRHVPAAVRSAVWLRDEARCTFVDARGVRCRATTALELHHEQPFARGGPATAENLRLRCRAHNELAAEQDFGRNVMLAKKRGPTSRCRRGEPPSRSPH